jgi:hypothetical protein
MLDTGASPLERPSRPDDRDFILGLMGRFAEFAPRRWRTAVLRSRSGVGRVPARDFYHRTGLEPELVKFAKLV